MKVAEKILVFCLLLCVQNLSAQDTINNSKHSSRKPFARINFIDNTLDSKTIQSTPYTDINKFRLFNSAAVYYGSSYYLEGLTSSGDNCYIDGMLISDISMFPKSAIKNYTLYSNFSPIEIEAVLNGSIVIQTMQTPEKTTFDINVLCDFTANKYFNINQKGVDFLLNSPISFLKSIYKNKNVQPSILIAGNLNFTKDPSPSYIGITSVNSDTYSQIMENPLVSSGMGSGTYKSGEFLTDENLTTSALKQNANRNSFNPYIKLTLPISENMKLTLGSYISLNFGKQGIYQNTLLNFAQNPEIQQKNFNYYIRFDHNFVINRNLKSNYTIQINYTDDHYLEQSSQHKDNFFDYGYVGKFNSYRVRTYEKGTDPTTGITAYLQNGYADTLVAFEPSDINPILSNYSQNYFDFYNNATGHYRNLDEILLGGGLINGEFLSQNSIYGMYYNVGMPYDVYQKSNFNNLNPKAEISFDYKKNHHFTLGFELNKTSSSSYTLNPVELWSIARQQTNKHILQLDLYNPHLVYDHYGIFQDTIWYSVLYNAAEQSTFDKNLRKKLGLAIDGTEWIDVYSYDPKTFSLDMFSADELLNGGNSIVSYNGYDYAGNKLKGKSNYDYFSDKNKDGSYTRNIGAFKPVYLDAFAQYTYKNKRLTCNVGFRFDRYDANQPVLKDPYLLFNAKSAGEVTNLGVHPANIGSDYVVYVDDILNPTRIMGYRNGDIWYNAQGVKIDDQSSIETSSGIAPYLEDPKQVTVNSTAFKDYKPALNYLPLLNVDYLVTRTTQIFGDFQMSTQNPVNNNYRPDQYYFIYTYKDYIINNPDLKPQKISIARVGARQMILNSIQAEVFYQYKNVKGLTDLYKLSGAFPYSYYIVKNSKDDFENHAVDISLKYKETGKNEFDIGIYYERLLNENKKFKDVILSNNVINGFVQYSLDKSFLTGNQPELKPVLIVSLAGHYRSDTYFPGTNKFVSGKTKTNLPDFYYFDLKVEKPFYFGKHKDISASVYVAVQNIFNKKNVFTVFSNTGRTDDDGYLTDPNFQAQIAAQTSEQSYRELYAKWINNYTNYDIPRMLIFGFRFNL